MGLSYRRGVGVDPKAGKHCLVENMPHLRSLHYLRAWGRLLSSNEAERRKGLLNPASQAT